jgi:hypothetical protein
LTERPAKLHFDVAASRLSVDPKKTQVDTNFVGSRAESAVITSPCDVANQPFYMISFPAARRPLANERRRMIFGYRRLFGGARGDLAFYAFCGR